MTRYLVGLGLVLGACHLGVRRVDHDPVAAGLQLCSARLGGGVADKAQLSDSLQCLLELSAANPDDGRVYAVVARTLDARALAFPDPVVDDMSSARSFALRCLALRPGVAARLEASGGLVNTRVLAVVPATDVACVAWAGITWSRWLYGRGVLGDAIDLAAVAALGNRAVALGPELESRPVLGGPGAQPGHRAAGPWARRPGRRPGLGTGATAGARAPAHGGGNGRNDLRTGRGQRRVASDLGSRRGVPWRGQRPGSGGGPGGPSPGPGAVGSGSARARHLVAGTNGLRHTRRDPAKAGSKALGRRRPPRVCARLSPSSKRGAGPCDGASRPGAA